MLDPQQHKSLHRNYKRLMWFIPLFFVFALAIFFVLYTYAHLSPVLIGFIIICIATVFYLLFLFVCAKIDKKKDEKRESESNRDPFRH